MIVNTRVWRWITGVSLLICLGPICGCSKPQSSDTPGSGGTTLSVIAPPILQGALKKINSSFEATHPGTRIDLKLQSFGHIRNSADATSLHGDVLFWMDGERLTRDLQKAAVFDEKRKSICGQGPLILAVPKGNPQHIIDIRDLQSPEITRIAATDPTRDTTGLVFKDVLKTAGLWESVQNKVLCFGSPIAACDAVRDGKADVAVAYLPLVRTDHSKKALTIAAFFPDRAHNSVDIAVAPSSSTTNPLADDYISYVQETQAQLALGQAGFQPAKRLDPTQAERFLDVPCGAGLQPAMDELGRMYLDRTGVRVDYRYAGAGMLISTLMTSRQGDLYIPGEAFYVDQARKHGFIAEDKTMCFMTPVIAFRKGNPKDITRLEDLARPGLRVALGDPQAIAIGPMTERILQRAGIFDAVERQVHMKAACVPELANALATHSADAGIIWDVMAVQNVKSLDSIPIDPKYNEASEVLVSRLTCSKKQAEAKKLMEFLISDEAAAVFHKYGYGTKRPAGIRLAPREKVGRKK